MRAHRGRVWPLLEPTPGRRAGECVERRQHLHVERRGQDREQVHFCSSGTCFLSGRFRIYTPWLILSFFWCSRLMEECLLYVSPFF